MNDTTPGAIARKAAIRAEILAARDATGREKRMEMSLRAAETGNAFLQFCPDTIISSFLPIRSEIDPRPLMAELSRRGARLCLPVVQDKTTIIFREYDPGEPLIDTGFGTLGPRPGSRIVDPEILIMPLAAFDASGNRLGYGAGHYDRAIQRLEHKNRRPYCVGLAFCMQQVSEIPAMAHDRKMHGIITEAAAWPFGHG